MLRRPLRLPQWSEARHGAGDPRIFAFNAERDEIVRAVVDRVVENRGTDSGGLELLLNETAHLEVERLELQRDEESDESLNFWRDLTRRISRLDDGEKREMLRRITLRMSADVAGNFDARVFRFARRIIPPAIAGIMNPPSVVRGVLDSESRSLDRLVRVEGPVDELRGLAKLGTLILVPTHVSNLDSLAIGESLDRMRLPPVVYGAGKNLFSNPLTSFFMHNLGAYRVDRRVQARLYKDVLKAYSCVMIERGYHSLFFPGGTRSRSGMVEQQLKLGLAGTGIEAFARNCVRGRPAPVFFVPVTINFALVLEAESLIGEYLERKGKAHYIIDDDEFGRIDRWLSFLHKLRGTDGACVLRYGPALDPFGNPVDPQGRSLGPGGRIIDATRYVSRGGKPVLDRRRDAGYARELGRVLVDSYRRQTVLMGTNLVAHVLFRKLVSETPGVDLFGRMRRRGDVRMTREELVRQVGEARDCLLDLEADGELRVGSFLRREDPQPIVDRVLAAWEGYHSKTIVATHRGGRSGDSSVTIEDPPLLLYYQNRLVSHAEALAGHADLRAGQEIADLGEER
jgi:glycerol-3-phosphate O-acyltransferase